jgi:ATP-dependent RNA helicase RhlB
LNNDIMNLAARWMRPNPVKMEVEPEHVVADGIDETVYALRAEEKLPALLWTLSHEDCRRVLIFRNRRSEVEELHEELKRYGVASEMLSGDVDQKKRLRILEDFKAGRIQVIVATDVAGRGIHVDDVTHVINYDFPYEAEDYVHRVGRTARAGHRGRAISFADEYSSFVIPDIEKFIARPLPITQPTDEMLKLPDEFKNVRPHVEKPHSMRNHANNRGGNYRGGRVRRGGPRR